MSYVRRPNPDPERQAAVVHAFVDLYGRLEPLLGDRWLGAWNQLERFVPALAIDLEAAEARADDLAREFVRRAVGEEDFRGALEAYEDQWERAARVLGTLSTWPDRPVCSVCSRNDAVTSIMQDGGTWLCSGCHRPGPSSSRK